MQLIIMLDKHKLGHVITLGLTLICILGLTLICILCQIFPNAMRNRRRILNRSDSITCAFKKANFDSNEDVKEVKLKEGRKLVRR